MIIKLDRDFRIEVDELNHTLKQKYMAKTRDGEDREAEKVIGYFPSVEACIEKYIDVRQKLLKDEQVLSLREYVNLVKKSNNEAVKSLKKLIGVK